MVKRSQEIKDLKTKPEKRYYHVWVRKINPIILMLVLQITFYLFIVYPMISGQNLMTGILPILNKERESESEKVDNDQFEQITEMTLKLERDLHKHDKDKIDPDQFGNIVETVLLLEQEVRGFKKKKSGGKVRTYYSAPTKSSSGGSSSGSHSRGVSGKVTIPDSSCSSGFATLDPRLGKRCS